MRTEPALAPSVLVVDDDEVLRSRIARAFADRGYQVRQAHDSASATTIPRFFQVHLGDRHFETGTVTVLPFRTFCRELNLP